MAHDAAHVPPAFGGTYPLRPGNRVRPLVDGVPAFRRIADAVETARTRVWVTVAFLDRDVRLPDGRTFFDLLDAAAARGLDVRVLFWREPTLPAVLPDSGHFAGTDEERRWLAARGARLCARWDHLPRYCHHQKSWTIDAGEPGAVAFVGGINLDPGSMVPPGHPPRAEGPSIHDVYVEVEGPATTDVAHNFVQRWNEASERGRADGVWPDAARAGDLPFPHLLAPPAGDVPVQITRTVAAERYRNPVAAPGAAAHPIAGGESSVLEQYVNAVDAARRTIYVENQFIASPRLLERLDAALRRGVEVVYVVPGDPMAQVRAARRHPRAASFFAGLAAMGSHPGFTLAALVAPRPQGGWAEVYVHAKIALVDDAWATIGSANVMTRSFHADTELNASFWHAPTVRALRAALFVEHLGADTTAMDGLQAIELFRETATANATRRARGEPLAGLAVAIDPATYAA